MSFYLFADSFGRYKVANSTSDTSLFTNLQQRYTEVANGGGGVAVDAAGRTNNALRCYDGAGVSKTMPHSARWVTGFAFKYDFNTPGNAAVYEIRNNDAILFSLSIHPDGTLSLGANENHIAVTDRSLFDNTWYYLEIDAEFTGTTSVTCAASLRINGHVEATGSGTVSGGVTAGGLLSYPVDTSGHPSGNVHVWTGPTGGGIGGSGWFDDLYVKNAAGYYGDIRIVPLVPNGEGTTLQWTPDLGTVHYDRVNTIPEDLTKWLESNTVGNIDTWNWQDCPSFTGTIPAINISILADKDDEGTRAFEIVVGPTGTLAASQDFYVSDVVPEYYEYGLENDPNTAAPWTQAGFNATQWGIKLTV